MAETAVAHRCPPRERTPRAERVALIGDPRYGRNLSERDKQRVADQIAADHAEMRERGLCLTCGYPLNGSYPHPDSQQARWERGRR